MDFNTEHPAFAVGTADVGVFHLAAAIQPHENAVVMLVLVEQLFVYEIGNDLPVDLQAAVDLIELAVVLKNSAHVMQHPHDGFTHREGTII